MPEAALTETKNARGARTDFPTWKSLMKHVRVRDFPTLAVSCPAALSDTRMSLDNFGS